MCDAKMVEEGKAEKVLRWEKSLCPIHGGITSSVKIPCDQLETVLSSDSSIDFGEFVMRLILNQDLLWCKIEDKEGKLLPEGSLMDRKVILEIKSPGVNQHTCCTIKQLSEQISINSPRGCDQTWSMTLLPQMDDKAPDVLVARYPRELFPDLKILVRGEEVSCHAAVLARSSKYFAKLLGSEGKELKERRLRLDEDPILFKSFLNFIYDDEKLCECCIWRELKGAQKLELISMAIRLESEHVAEYLLPKIEFTTLSLLESLKAIAKFPDSPLKQKLLTMIDLEIQSCPSRLTEELLKQATER